MSKSCLAPSSQSERFYQGSVSRESQRRKSPSTTSIHFLDDDSLLNVFHLYRPLLLGERQHINIRLGGGGQSWVGERWWYRLAHVCQRWRNLMLGSKSYLGLCLVCTYGTPVADMLAHSPPLPLVIDYYYGHNITSADEEAIILALAQRDRVCRIRLDLPVMKLQKLIVAIDGEYPILEYLILTVPPKERTTVLILPVTLQTSRLRHLTIDCSIPTPFQLLTTAVGLVTLCLRFHHPSTYFKPTVLLQPLSLMTQLEVLMIVFFFTVPNYDVENQLMRTPIMTQFTLPNLRSFTFQAPHAYSEAVFSRITAPRLEHLQIGYFKQLTFSVPEFLQFMARTGNFRFNYGSFDFHSDRVYVQVNPPDINMPLAAFSVLVRCWHHNWQVSYMGQFFNALSQILSAVDHLTLMHQVRRSSEEHNDVDRTEWRNLLRLFSNVKTLRIDNGLVGEFSRYLRVEDSDGEHSLELLPELQELTCPGSSDDIFTSFIDARQKAGRPVTLIKS